MIVKVNRINTKKEIVQLLSVGVDIVGISLKLSDKNLDSRALRMDEIQKIQREVSIPNLSLNLNIREYRKEDIVKVAEILKPNSINIFIEASSIIDPKKFNEEQLSTIRTVNETELDVISFGNGFGYDCPCTIPNSLGIYKNLRFEEINIDTLGSNSKQRIKNRNEWAEHLKIEKIEQSKLGDTILESITESMQNRPFLVDDRNIDTVAVEKLNEIDAKGITMSLSSLIEDEYSQNLPNANHIASLFDMQKILKITKRVKSYGS